MPKVPRQQKKGTKSQQDKSSSYPQNLEPNKVRWTQVSQGTPAQPNP